MENKDNPVKAILRAFYLFVFRIMPFQLAISIVFQWPRKSKYLPLGKKIVFDKYLGNLSVEVDTTFPIERDMLSGTFAPDLQSFLKNNIKNGYVCIDIGANVGAITLAMGKQVAPNGHVIAFEPGPPTFKKLKKNISLNPTIISSVSCFQVGLSDKPGTLQWLEETHNRGNASLLSNEGTPVPVTTLDLFLLKHPVQRLDFIKIDVEGMEYEVLKGAIDSINRFHPTLFFESHVYFEEMRGKPLFSLIELLLSKSGYQFYIIRNSKIIQIKSIYQSHSDTLAIHESRLHEFPEIN